MSSVTVLTGLRIRSITFNPAQLSGPVDSILPVDWGLGSEPKEGAGGR